MKVSIGARLLHASVLIGFLALALYFPYWWFGVVPFGTDYEMPQAEVQQYLDGKDVPDFYAQPLPEISAEELAWQKEQFTWCRFCHTLNEGGEHRVGPNLFMIYGKPAAVIGGFAYSAAFEEAREEGLIWTPETMADFIADPHDYVPGNRMRYPPMIGYEMSAERDQAIIDYLLRCTGPNSQCEADDDNGDSAAH